MIRGYRPTTLLLRKQPRSKWNHLDFVLLAAYQAYEDEDGKHGLPYWITRNPDPGIILSVDSYPDYAEKAMAEWDEKNGDKKKKNHLIPFVVALDADGNPLEYGGLTRQRFREAAIQDEQDRDDGIDIERDRPERGYDPAEYGDGLTDPA